MTNQSNGKLVRFEPSTGCYRIDSFYECSQSVATLVVTAVAKATDQDIQEVDTLANTINPDALNQLFESPLGYPLEGENSTVEFEYCDCTVAVSKDGTISVEPPENTSLNQ